VATSVRIGPNAEVDGGAAGPQMGRHAQECVASRRHRVIAVFRLVKAQERAVNEKAPALTLLRALFKRRTGGARALPFEGGLVDGRHLGCGVMRFPSRGNA
jgi:hypothetical protein